jgi:hypothetical protein
VGLALALREATQKNGLVLDNEGDRDRDFEIPVPKMLKQGERGAVPGPPSSDQDGGIENRARSTWYHPRYHATRHPAV